MQAALDSTALMLGKDLTEGAITTSQLSEKAGACFKALYTNTETKSVAITAAYTQNSGNGSMILVNGSGNIETGFMRVVGFPTMDFKTSSTSTWGVKRMRVALALALATIAIRITIRRRTSHRDQQLMTEPRQSGSMRNSGLNAFPQL